MPGVLQTPSAAIAVFEREPFWAPELQRQFADGSVLVRTCSRLIDLDAVAAEWPRCVGIIDFDTAPATILNWLARSNRDGHARWFVFARAASADFEWLLRECGALSFRTELVSGRDLANHCRRVLRAVSRDAESAARSAGNDARHSEKRSAS